MIGILPIATLAASVALAVVPHHHHRCDGLKGKLHWGCRTRWHWVTPRRTLGHYSVEATCYHEGSITSDGHSPYIGEVANNFLPLGTRIRLDRPVFGVSEFVIKDHIGEGSELDIYGPSEEACNNFGRTRLGFSVIS